ncbi:flagellar hook-length control protein FliK [Fusibacter bizertensis]
MQLRELLNNKQVLNPLIEVKNVSQKPGLEVFNEILTRKNEKISKPESIQSGYSEKNSNDKNEYAKKDKPFSVRPAVTESNKLGSKQTEVGVSNPKTEKNDSDGDNKIQSKSSQKTEKSSNEVKNENEKSDLTEKLKQKLKKETGMNDQQLDQLLASLNLDVTMLQKLLTGGPELGEALKVVGDVLDTLAIDTTLGQNLSSKDVSQIVKQLEQSIESLEKMAKEVPSKGDSESKSFESQLVQKLSQVIASLESSDAKTTIMPQELSEKVVAAISSNELSANTTETVKPSSTDINEGLVPNKPITEVNTDNANSSKTSDSRSEGDQPQSKMNQATVMQNAEISPTNVSKTTQNVVSDSAVEVENNVKVVETSEGISVHQVTMKNGNFVTTQTTTVTPVMKQEIVTQIMDAIKGQIKLSDQGTSMIVKLQPEQLGNVELKLNIQKGVVLAELKVENEIVKAAIESNLDDLKQSLSNKGYSVDQISVSIDSGKKEGQEAFDFQGREQNQKNKTDSRLDNGLELEPVEQISRYELNELEGSTFSYYG